MVKLGLVAALIVLLSLLVQGRHRSLKICAPGKELRKNGQQEWKCKRCKDGSFSYGGSEPRCKQCRTCTHGYRKKCSRKKNAVCKKLSLADCIRLWPQHQEVRKECRGHMKVLTQILGLKCQGKGMKKKHCMRKMMKKVLQYEYNSARSTLVRTPTSRPPLPNISTTTTTTAATTTAAATTTTATTVGSTPTVVTSYSTLALSAYNEANYEEQESGTQPPEPEETNYIYLAGLVCPVVLLVLIVILLTKRHVKDHMLKDSSTQHERALDGNVYSSDRSNLDESLQTQANVTFHEDTTTDMKSVDIPATDHCQFPQLSRLQTRTETSTSQRECSDDDRQMKLARDLPHMVSREYDPDRQWENWARSLPLRRPCPQAATVRLCSSEGVLRYPVYGSCSETLASVWHDISDAEDCLTSVISGANLSLSGHHPDTPVRSRAPGTGGDDTPVWSLAPGTGRDDTPVRSLALETGGDDTPVRSIASGTGGDDTPVRSIASGTGGVDTPVRSLAPGTGGDDTPVRSLASGTGGDDTPVRSLALGTGGNDTPVRSLALGTGGDDTPVRSLASGTGGDERTSRDTLLQSDISQTSSETEDEDFSADTDSHSSEGSPQVTSPAEICLLNNCTSTNSSIASTRLANFTNNLDYQKHLNVRPENVYGNLLTSKGTQTKYNHENTRTIFGYEWNKSADFTSMGGLLAIPKSDITLEVPRDAVPKGESVCVQAFVSPEFHNLQPFMDDDEVVVSPVGEYQMSCKRKWDRHVKIHIPCIQRNPKETFRVRFFQKNSSGNVEFGDVPVKEDGLNQELYYVKKENHVEIFTVHFTGFFCSVCGHTCPLDLLALVFGCYGHHGNEAWITLVVGDRRNSIPEVRQKIIDKEKALNGSELVAERPVRLVEAYDCQSRLMFTLHVRSHAEMWRNADTDSGDQQVRRLRELIRCSCSKQPNVTSSEFESHHQCEDNLQWVYSCGDPPPDTFSCKILVEHLLNGDVVTPRHDACKEGVTTIIVPPVKLQRPQHFEQMKIQDVLPPMGFGELTSSRKPLFSHGTTFSSTRPVYTRTVDNNK